MMISATEFMLRSGFSKGQVVAHFTFHTTLATMPNSELLAILTVNSLVTFYGKANAVINWFNTNVSEEVVLHTSPVFVVSRL